jgi:hypothetical protein
MTTATPDVAVAAIVIATPTRTDLGDYRAIVFRGDVAEISPRFDYAAAKAWVADRGAVLGHDEHDHQPSCTTTTFGDTPSNASPPTPP